ncbi:MAG TPA: hypothetical protein VHE14_07875, partial [Solirubrobacteraceae bacterium]|nr:hypothetical protein [Solirubrobacteraceae bacterium]
PMSAVIARRVGSSSFRTRPREKLVRMYLAGGLAVVLALSLTSTAFASDQFKQTADVKLTAKKAKQSSGISSDVESADPGAPGGKPKGASKVVLTFPSKTKFNTKAKSVALCTADDQTVGQQGAAACPPKSVVGTGTAAANASPLVASIAENIQAFNAPGGIIFYVTPQASVGQPLVLRGQLSGATLTVNVPSLSILGIPVPLTSFVLNIPKKGSGKTAYITSGVCKGKKFTVKTDFTYDDGSAFQATSSSPCK